MKIFIAIIVVLLGGAAMIADAAGDAARAPAAQGAPAAATQSQAPR